MGVGAAGRTRSIARDPWPASARKAAEGRCYRDRMDDSWPLRSEFLTVLLIGVPVGIGWRLGIAEEWLGSNWQAAAIVFGVCVAVIGCKLMIGRAGPPP